ncbi:hypothetical protein E2R55_27170 [Vibrio vulnificus]|nr:hypothetical protein E2R55_27170 [Vibrio vulnificus]
MFIAGNLEKTNILSKKTKGFNKTKSKDGHTMKVAGTYYSHLKATSGSFGGDFTTTITTKTNAKSLKSSISHTSYGLRPSKSLLVLYKGSINRSCSNLKKCTFDNLKTYSGIPVYANTFAKSTVNSSDGTIITVAP